MEISTFIYTTFVSIGFAAAVSYGLYKVITVVGMAKKPKDYGRKWLAWAVAVNTMMFFPEFFDNLIFNPFDIMAILDPIAKWVLFLVLFGGIAFIAGWFYGRSIFGGRKSSK